MGRTKSQSTIPRIQAGRHVTLALVVVALLGIIGSVAAGIYANTLARNTLKQRAVDVAHSLPEDTIRSLSGSTADLQTASYLTLKEKLARLQASNDDARFVYVLGREDDSTLFVYADSESANTRASSVPGAMVSDPSVSLLGLHQTRTAFTEGPKSDEWGSWISGFAPIVSPETNEFVGAVGIDVRASNYYRTVAAFMALPLLLVAIPLVMMLRDRKTSQKERQAMETRNRFVAVAAHELRSPLSGMLWAMQSLLKPSVKNLTIEQQVILLDMYQSTEESLATINEILDMSVFERNKPQHLAKEPVEIGTIIKNATKTLRLSANERGIHFAFVGNWNGDDAYVVGDHNALKRMFMNLVANAIKYGRNDTEVSLRLTQKNGFHVVAVEDHGIGIPEAEQRKVLSGYYRASNAQKTKKLGTGLGLLLAKLVAEQHGGKLSLTSKEGKGTTVFVSLPVSQPPHGETKSDQSEESESA